VMYASCIAHLASYREARRAVQRFLPRHASTAAASARASPEDDHRKCRCENRECRPCRSPHHGSPVQGSRLCFKYSNRSIWPCTSPDRSLVAGFPGDIAPPRITVIVSAG
jgi:hypothetical protein